MYYSKRNLDFILHEVLGATELTKHERFEDHNRETFDMIVEAAETLATQKLLPILEEMDRKPPVHKDERILVHPKVRDLMESYGEAGWIAAEVDYEWGGQQLPSTIFNACLFIFGAANYSASVYPFLTTGAAGLILTFASEDLKKAYLPKMYEGKWQGTMALTEPDAGSSLSDITTSAEPIEDGYYKISGQKIFISCGDHDGVDNIVHLMLARIKGAPKGTKGISLFVVPRNRIDEEGKEVWNDVITAGCFHKMGYHGAPIAHLSMGENDDCRGYLVGSPNRGLSYMFQMMNGARISVGMSAASIASAAYYASLTYAKERPQGRIISNKDVNQPQVPIIQHADVKRMLLSQKAMVEGSVSLLLQCSYYFDISHVGTGEEKDKAGLLLDLLTPIAKSYPSEEGCKATSTAIQCLGGAGYCQDFPLEQFYREARIHPIHEGTTGIHGLDLLGRKVTMNDGAALKAFIAEVTLAIKEASAANALESHAQSLGETLEQLGNITMHLVNNARKHGLEVFLSDATLYLEAFGIVAIAWQWLLQGIAAQKAIDAGAEGEELIFYKSKLYTLRYFYEYELVKTTPLFQRLKSADNVTVNMETEFFV